MTKGSHIFVSYARKDDPEFVERLREDLSERGVTVWWDRAAMESRGLRFLQEIRDAIASAERLLLVMGPHARDSDYVKAEWQAALENCTVVTPVIRKGGYTLLPAEIAGLHGVDFQKDEDYTKSLEELVRILQTPPAPLGRIPGVPALPPYHVECPALQERLWKEVLPDLNEPQAARANQGVVALVGMAGSGKSVAAATFARTCDTRRAFDYGVVWVKAGRSADALDMLRQIGKHLGEAEVYGNRATAVAALSARVADKRCLIVVDDVWDAGAAELIADVLGTACRLLLTTQRADLAIAARMVPVDALDRTAAQRLLARVAGYSEEAALPEAAGDVIEESGYLPLPIAMIGAMLRGKPEDRWASLVERLRNVQLDRIRHQLPHYDHPSLLRAMHASVEALGDAEELPSYARDRYFDLAIFDLDDSIPEAVLATLWEPVGLAATDTQELCDALVDRSLMRRNDDGRYTLHNLQSDYLLSQHADLPAVHRRLVEAYKKRCAGNWATAQDDGYYYAALPRHLAGAGERVALDELMADPAWLRAKLARTDPWTLARDKNLAGDNRALELLYSALGMSAALLASHPEQLAGQLLGRLGGAAEPVLARLLEQLREQARAPWIEPLWPTLQRADGPLMWALEGHDGGAFSVATTPDGRRAAVGTMRGEVAIWDLETGRRVRGFRGPAKTAWSVANTHDGTLAAAAYGDEGIVVWDVASGSPVVNLKNKSNAMAVAFTADGKHIVGGEKDGSVRLWTVADGAEASSLEGRHESDIKCLATTKDGRIAVTGAKDGTLGVWDLEMRKIRRLIPAHQPRVQGVWSLALDRKGTRALYVTDKGLVVLTDIETGDKLALFWPDSFTMGCCFIGDGERAVTCDDAGDLKIWSLPEGKLLRALRGHKGFVDSVAAFSGSRVISASRDGTARVWDLEREGAVEVQSHDAPVLGVAVSNSLAGVCSASQDKTLKIWNAQDGKLLSTLDGSDSPLRAVAFLPGTTRILIGDGQGRLKRIDLRDLKTQAQVEPHVPAIRKTSEGTGFGFGGVVSLRIVRDGTLAWSCGSAGDYALWDLKEDKVSRQDLNFEPPFVGDITANGETVVLGLGNGSLAVLDLGEGSLTTVGGVSTAAAMDAIVDPSGQFAISSHVDGALIAWVLHQQKARILVPPDRAAEASITSWETGKREPASGTGAVVVARGLAVTAGGELLVAAFSDGWVRMWRLDSYQPYAAFHCDEALYSVAVDGLVVAVGGQHQVHLLKIHPG